MSSLFLPLFLLVVTLPLALLVVLLRRRAGLVAVDGHRTRLLSAQRVLVTSRWLALALGAAVLVALASTGAPLAIALAPVAGAAVGVLAMVAGQLSIARMATTGAAGLETRRVRDYVPRGQALAATVLVVAMLVAVPVGWRLGHGGSISFECVGAEGFPAGGSRSPWFGSRYWAPGLAVWVVGTAALAWGLRLVAARGRDGSDPAMVLADDALRRWWAGSLLAAWGVLSGALLVPALGTYRIGLDDGGMCARGGFGPWGAVAGWACAAAALLTVACLARLLLPQANRLVAHPAAPSPGSRPALAAPGAPTRGGGAR